MNFTLLDVVGESDVGLVRERNEDVLLVGDLTSGAFQRAGAHRVSAGERGVLLAVFDGMGGAMAGDRASAMAAEVLGREVMKDGANSQDGMADTLARALMRANVTIQREGRRNPTCRGMGTTVTVAAVVGGAAVLAHVGDSRAYVLRGETLVQVTEDQSLLSELVASGKINREEASHYEHSNVILQALGVTEMLNPYFAAVPLRVGDLLLLCTDGLTAQVSDEEICDVVCNSRDDLAAAAATLIERARRYGGYDNTTVLLAEVQGDDEGDDQQVLDVEIRPSEPLTMVQIRRKRTVVGAARLAVVGLLLLAALAGLAVLLMS